MSNSEEKKSDFIWWFSEIHTPLCRKSDMVLDFELVGLFEK